MIDVVQSILYFLRSPFPRTPPPPPPPPFFKVKKSLQDEN